MRPFWMKSAATMQSSGRIGDLLPSILRHENVSRVSDEGIYILDRRFLPFERKEVFCPTWRECVSAIKNMVTQGGGPLEVALNAIIHTSRTAPGELKEAVEALSLSRPTNTTMKREIATVYSGYERGGDIERLCMEVFNRYDRYYDLMSDIGESLINDGDGILTRCFPEHTFMLSCAKARRNGKRIRVYVPETRPYLQGAHLTEPCLREMGIECFLITDAMPSHFMREGKITLYMTAADLAFQSGIVVNKTGTLSDAVSALHYGIPYYAFSVSPSDSSEDIVIEYREGNDVRRIGNVQIASEDATALYPCFDIVDPEFVSGIITPEGIYEGNSRWNRNR